MISTWDKNVIQVDVEMTATANSDEKAQHILDEIEVKENRSGSTIYFKTDIGDQNNHGDSWSKNKKDGNNRKFEINYTVHMPVRQSPGYHQPVWKDQYGRLERHGKPHQ